eukprot:c9341_g1_i1.p1 GENE.c9341_g1_i1~~c9341_g1_i1.p1  ORF type:complete len:490 (+),score=82.57 c9341_g1_i1:24-1472(+)
MSQINTNILSQLVQLINQLSQQSNQPDAPDAPELVSPQLSSTEPNAPQVEVNDEIGSSVSDVQHRRKDLQKKIDETQNLLTKMYEELNRETVKQKAIESYNTSKEKKPTQTDILPPSQQKRTKYQKLTPEVKSLIVSNLLNKQSMTWKEAVKTFEVSESTIARVLKEEKTKKRKLQDDQIEQEINGEDNNIKPVNKKGRKSLITPDALCLLLDLVDKNSQITLHELNKALRDVYKIEVSDSSIARALATANITWKIVLPIPDTWNTPRIIQLRKHFVSEVIPKYENHLKCYVDESGFNLHLRNKKGRAYAGSPAKITVRPQGNRTTLIGAIANTGIVHYQIIPHTADGTKASDFRYFLLKLAPKLPKKSVIILDNCKIHHADELKDVWDILRTAYEIEHEFLPPYSPFLNPIELLFNDIKIELKKHEFQDKEELITTIETYLQSFPIEKCKSFETHARSFYPDCIACAPFLGSPIKPTAKKD